MTEKNTQETTESTQAPAAETPVIATNGDKPARRGRAPFKKDGEQGGRPRRTFDRPKQEFEQKIVNIRRVVRVMAGGRRFSFSVAMLLGDKKGRVGIGIGKSPDTALAIQKAVKDAKKNMIQIGLTEGQSLPHQVEAKYASSSLVMFPNNGKGLVAGSAVRDMLTLAGVKDVTAKINTRSKNKINISRAVIEAVKKLPGTKKVKVSLEEPKREPRESRGGRPGRDGDKRPARRPFTKRTEDNN